jgi:predicted GTPase
MLIRAKFPKDSRLKAVEISNHNIPERFMYENRVVIFRFIPTEFGAVLIRIGDEKPAADEHAEAIEVFGDKDAEYIMALHQWCREHKVDVIIFDRDARVVPGFPIYNW